ncbi:hypothetical protein ACEYW6_08925 [Nostoc sp. UIC 10607]|uniref:SMODS domain-containing nucleotidyltransferase n=1 Tax=Nostoc sp. UIC 10607 TaxID=3045935 RepID=UPI0039A17283
MTPNARFTELLQDIEPSPTTVTRAIRAHTAMRDFLYYHETFKKFHISTFLSGSYKRDTAIRPRLKNGDLERPDVDIIVVTNYTTADCPKKVVDQLYDAIADGYEQIRPQDRSVGVSTGYADMDVVPIIKDYSSGGFLIPDRTLVEWLPTNPPMHTAWTTQINDAAGGRFKPLVKLMKWWRRHNQEVKRYPERHPKGFVIECITAECMDYQETHYGKLFVKTLENIVTRYQPYLSWGRVPMIADPGVPGNSVASGISYEDFQKYVNLAQEHAAQGRLALQEEDPEEMTKLWRDIFGLRFPATKILKSTDLLGNAVSVKPLFFPNRPVQPNKPAGFA